MLFGQTERRKGELIQQTGWVQGTEPRTFWEPKGLEDCCRGLRQRAPKVQERLWRAPFCSGSRRARPPDVSRKEVFQTLALPAGLTQSFVDVLPSLLSKISRNSWELTSLWSRLSPSSSFQWGCLTCYTSTRMEHPTASVSSFHAHACIHTHSLTHSQKALSRRKYFTVNFWTVAHRVLHNCCP